MNVVIDGIRKVLTSRKYFFLFIFLSFLLFLLFLAIPVKTVPGNTFAFQLSLLGTQGFILLGLLSGLTSLSLVFHLHVLKHRHSLGVGASLLGSGGTGFLSGIIATIFGTATCAYCVSAFFGFLGIGGVLFLLQYRTWITLGAIVLMLVSLYFTAQKVLGVCATCHVGRKHK